RPPRQPSSWPAVPGGSSFSQRERTALPSQAGQKNRDKKHTDSAPEKALGSGELGQRSRSLNPGSPKHQAVGGSQRVAQNPQQPRVGKTLRGEITVCERGRRSRRDQRSLPGFVGPEPDHERQFGRSFARFQLSASGRNRA